MQEIKKFFSWFYHFVTHEIWHLKLEDLPKAKSILVRQLRIIVLAFRGFKEDECRLRASALTYYSMMSIVPIAAMAFAIAKGFGFEQLLEQRIKSSFSGDEKIITMVVKFANTLIEQTQGGVIAGIGLVILLWSVMEVLSHIEESFNEIWEQKEGRSLMRKFSDYFAMMLIAPILIIVSSGATAFVSSAVNTMEHQYRLLGYVGPFFSFLMKWSPFILSWFLFTLVYMVMPNTKVKFKSAFVGGIISGTVYQLTQMGYFILQLELIDANAVYGSFAALPLLFLWLRISWVALLMGAEISYAHQNAHKFHYDLDVAHISAHHKRTLSLLMMHLLVKRFANSEKPFTDDEISQQLAVPVRVIRQILYELIECGLVSELKTHDYKEFAYQPATDIHLISIQYVVEKLDMRGQIEVKLHATQQYKAITEAMNTFNETIEQNPSNKLLMEI
jgi:membrane protein